MLNPELTDEVSRQVQDKHGLRDRICWDSALFLGLVSGFLLDNTLPVSQVSKSLLWSVGGTGPFPAFATWSSGSPISTAFPTASRPCLSPEAGFSSQSRVFSCPRWSVLPCYDKIHDLNNLRRERIWVCSQFQSFFFSQWSLGSIIWDLTGGRIS